MEHLQSFIQDCDRKTELAKRRLAETQDELSAEVAAKANKVSRAGMPARDCQSGAGGALWPSSSPPESGCYATVD